MRPAAASSRTCCRAAVAPARAAPPPVTASASCAATLPPDCDARCSRRRRSRSCPQLATPVAAAPAPAAPKAPVPAPAASRRCGTGSSGSNARCLPHGQPLRRLLQRLPRLRRAVHLERRSTAGRSSSWSTTSAATATCGPRPGESSRRGRPAASVQRLRRLRAPGARPDPPACASADADGWQSRTSTGHDSRKLVNVKAEAHDLVSRCARCSRAVKADHFTPRPGGPGGTGRATREDHLSSAAARCRPVRARAPACRDVLACCRHSPDKVPREGGAGQAALHAQAAPAPASRSPTSARWKVSASFTRRASVPVQGRGGSVPLSHRPSRVRLATCTITEGITIRELAEKLDVRAKDLAEDADGSRRVRQHQPGARRSDRDARSRKRSTASSASSPSKRRWCWRLRRKRPRKI